MTMTTELSKISKLLEQERITEDKALSLLQNLVSNNPRFSEKQIITDGIHEAEVVGPSEIEFRTPVRFLHNDCLFEVPTSQWDLK